MDLSTILASRPPEAGPPPPPARRPGRRAVAADPAERARHIEVLEDRLVRGLKLTEVSRLRDVSPRTVQLWVKQALAYDDERTDAIRRLMSRAS